MRNPSPISISSPRETIASPSPASSLAGMRVGLAFAAESLVREILKVKDSYNVGRLSQVAACAALADTEYFRATRDRVLSTRVRFSADLASLGFTVLPSSANFVFAVPPAGMTAQRLYAGLLARGFLVRHLAAPEVSDGLRISIGTDADMAGLLRAIEEERHGGQ